MAVMDTNLNPKPALIPLPPGFRFRPSEEELLSHYLPSKLRQIENQNTHLPWDDLIPLVNLYEYDPSDLPITHNRYYCFSSSKKHAHRRKARGGMWRSRGAQKGVVMERDGIVLGCRKRFVFYRRRRGLPPNKTNWVLNEYTLSDSSIQASFSLCCVQLKSRPPRMEHPPHSAARSNTCTELCKTNGSISQKEENESHRPQTGIAGHGFQREEDESHLPQTGTVGHGCEPLNSYELERLLMRLSDTAEYFPAAEAADLVTPCDRQASLYGSVVQGHDDCQHACIFSGYFEGDFIELDDLLPLHGELAI